MWGSSRAGIVDRVWPARHQGQPLIGDHGPRLTEAEDEHDGEWEEFDKSMVILRLATEVRSSGAFVLGFYASRSGGLISWTPVMPPWLMQSSARSWTCQ